MQTNIAFVYYKENKKIKVLSSNEAKDQQEQLIRKGYKHTATIDACIWIAYLLNEVKPDKIVEYVRSLTK